MWLIWISTLFWKELHTDTNTITEPDCQCLIPITHKPCTLGLHYISATKVKEDEKKMKLSGMRMQKKEESLAVGEGHKAIFYANLLQAREIIFDSSGFSAQGNLISRTASVF